MLHPVPTGHRLMLHPSIHPSIFSIISIFQPIPVWARGGFMLLQQIQSKIILILVLVRLGTDEVLTSVFLLLSVIHWPTLKREETLTPSGQIMPVLWALMRGLCLWSNIISIYVFILNRTFLQRLLLLVFPNMNCWALFCIYITEKRVLFHLGQNLICQPSNTVSPKALL